MKLRINTEVNLELYHKYGDKLRRDIMDRIAKELCEHGPSMIDAPVSVKGDNACIDVTLYVLTEQQFGMLVHIANEYPEIRNVLKDILAH